MRRAIPWLLLSSPAWLLLVPWPEAGHLFICTPHRRLPPGTTPLPPSGGKAGGGGGLGL
jgi:hypothetical protein